MLAPLAQTRGDRDHRLADSSVFASGLRRHRSHVVSVSPTPGACLARRPDKPRIPRGHLDRHSASLQGDRASTLLRGSGPQDGPGPRRRLDSAGLPGRCRRARRAWARGSKVAFNPAAAGSRDNQHGKPPSTPTRFGANKVEPDVVERAAQHAQASARNWDRSSAIAVSGHAPTRPAAATQHRYRTNTGVISTDRGPAGESQCDRGAGARSVLQ